MRLNVIEAGNQPALAAATAEETLLTDSTETSPPSPLQGQAESGKQKLVVLLHGFPETALLCWYELIPKLVAAGYFVVRSLFVVFNIYVNAAPL